MPRGGRGRLVDVRHERIEERPLLAAMRADGPARRDALNTPFVVVARRLRTARTVHPPSGGGVLPVQRARRSRYRQMSQLAAGVQHVRRPVRDARLARPDDERPDDRAARRRHVAAATRHAGVPYLPESLTRARRVRSATRLMRHTVQLHFASRLVDEGQPVRFAVQHGHAEVLRLVIRHVRGRHMVSVAVNARVSDQRAQGLARIAARSVYVDAAG